MQLSDLRRSPTRNEECAKIWRGFITAFDEGTKDVANGHHLSVRNEEMITKFGSQLLSREEEMARFLERDMDLLSPDERYRIYRHIGGFFPKQLPRILAARLRKEKDEKCRDSLKRIDSIPRDELSKTKTANFCQELFHAEQLLCHHDVGRMESEQNERLRDFRKLAWAYLGKDIDRVDMLVLFSLGREPKDRELFLKIVENLTDMQLLNHKETKSRIFEALIFFGQEERVRRLKTE